MSSSSSSSSKSRSKFSNAPVLPLFTRSTPSPSPSPSPPPTPFHRASSPTRVSITPTTPSPFRISLNNRALSPTSRASLSRAPVLPSKFPKRTCSCSPTSHPGSFRCALHRKTNNNTNVAPSTNNMSPMRLNLMRSAMSNSLVRIGTVEGDWVKRALTALIRPSSHQQRRRGQFRPRLSRLSVMSKADDVVIKDDSTPP